jgi:hypothetical protein
MIRLEKLLGHVLGYLSRPMQGVLLLAVIILVSPFLVPDVNSIPILGWIHNTYEEHPLLLVLSTLGALSSLQLITIFARAIRPESTVLLIPFNELRGGATIRRTLEKNRLRYDVSKSKGIVRGPFCPKKKLGLFRCDTRLSIESGVGPYSSTRWVCPGCDASGPFTPLGIE